MDAYSTLAERMANAKAEEEREEVEGPIEDTNWYDEYKFLEQRYMVLLDEYAELATAAGFEPRGFWGDVFEPHSKIVERINNLRAFYNEYY